MLDDHMLKVYAKFSSYIKNSRNKGTINVILCTNIQDTYVSDNRKIKFKKKIEK